MSNQRLVDYVSELPSNAAAGIDLLIGQYGGMLAAPTELETVVLRCSIFAAVLEAIQDSNDDNALRRLLNQLHGLSIVSLPEHRPSIYVRDDFRERQHILRFLAEEPYPQYPGGPAVVLDKKCVTPLVYAAFQVAPLRVLGNIVANIRNGGHFETELIMGRINRTLKKLARTWKGKTLDPIGARRPPLREAPRMTALRRDGGKCSLTEADDAEACHIYPHAAILQADDFRADIGVLSAIWGEEQIKAIQAQLGANHVDVPQNILTLDCRIHHLMDHFKVVLEPLEGSCTDTKLTLRLRWLQNSKLNVQQGTHAAQAIDDGIDLDTHPDMFLMPYKHKFRRGEDADFTARQVKTGLVIKDGFQFQITTDDPVTLPSLDLLRLHRNMSLMLTLAGAADIDDEYFSSESPPPGSAASTFEGPSDVDS